MVPLAVSGFRYNLSILHDVDMAGKPELSPGKGGRRELNTPGEPEVLAVFVPGSPVGKTVLPVQRHRFRVHLIRL